MPERGVADETALATIRSGFRATAPERLAQLRRHADAWKAQTPGAAAQLAQSSHTLRLTADSLGFSEVARIAGEMERLADGDAPPFSPHILGLLQSLADAFSLPPNQPHAPPQRPRVLLRLTDSLLAGELTRALEALGVETLGASSDDEALRMLTSERPAERLVVGPILMPTLRSALRTLNTPPLLIQMVPAAEARAGGREGVDAVFALGTPPSLLAREIASLQRSAPVRFRVLAVDEDSSVLASARAVLEAAGMEVVTLNDARNLFSSLQRHHPDLLLLDVAMPSVDGLELLSQLRGEPAWRNLTIVFQTSRDTATERVRAFQLGVDDYLLKPVQPSELRVRLLSHLQRRASLRSSLEKEATTGLANAHSLVRTLTRHLEASTSVPVSVALIRFPRPDAASEHASRLSTRLRPSDMLARWDERTLALTRPGEDARATLSFLQAPPGLGDAQVGVADNRAQPGTGAQALLVAAELNVGKSLERQSAALRVEGPSSVSFRPSPPPGVSSPVTRPPLSRPETLPPLPPRAPPPVTTARHAPLPPRDEASPTPRPLSPQARADSGAAAGASRSRRILVADDEPALRRVLQRLLEQEGYVVETAEDGEEALNRLLNPSLTPVDLLLLDVHMPRRSGIDVLRTLKEKGSTVRALVLSARVRDGDVVSLLGEGAADFVAKPFSIHTLLARVSRLLVKGA
ncbi:Two-component response regulator, PleD family, consists of two REC domains and a diguanylate cyclase (GGDEF) domain [Stigmatella aurantiaca]|uniref:Two-component response regulator, PleD family, consists of two REC domains and a diguanylate cyclase (GGDEF) domain n=1 Tax=Stigmatella aurantiaca TaxID=41 RepID=A0A1H7KW58_STIAU|nr:response regulator [Stigmatella aurantiaca]SEK90998.1 Two-component response regulator, PleD family, consists of two REC domains and a diguanylate cyclase (GGDEF) domain [Stigmatella aurantiaca]